MITLCFTRGKTARRRAPTDPASSEARSTNVLDRMWRRLTEHDLRMKLDRIRAQNDERRPPPPPDNQESPPRCQRDMERQPMYRRRNERSPPREEGRGERVPRREPRVEYDAQSHNEEKRNNRDSPPLSRRSSSNNRGPRQNEGNRIEGIRRNELRRLSTEWENEKKALAPTVTPSPFSRAIRVAPLPQILRHNPDFTFYGDSDPATYLVLFNMEMVVYQEPLHVRCRLFAAYLRGSAQK